jgi:hypothetical protein
MPIRDELKAAVDAGILTGDQSDRLAAFLASRGAVEPAPPAIDPDDESLRFLRSFQDIFLTLGVVMLVIGTFWSIGGGLGWMVGTLVALGLAYVLARRYRLLLPSMALAVLFVVGAGLAIAFLLIPSLLFAGVPLQHLHRPELIVGSFAAATAALAFYRLFRLPFALGLFAAAIAFFGFSLAKEFSPDWTDPAILILGLGIFIAAMAFDMRDPTRRTARSDIAFWLHLVAAPLIMRGTVNLLVGASRFDFTAADALVVVAILVAMTVIALVIDRRALMVSGIGYLGFALMTLMREVTAGRTTAALVLVVLGVVVLALALGWKQLRRALLGPFPRKGFLLHLPPVGYSAG